MSEPDRLIAVFARRLWRLAIAWGGVTLLLLGLSWMQGGRGWLTAADLSFVLALAHWWVMRGWSARQRWAYPIAGLFLRPYLLLDRDTLTEWKSPQVRAAFGLEGE